jgi:hypothetical protein
MKNEFDELNLDELVSLCNQDQPRDLDLVGSK